MAPHLAERFTVVMPDLRGYGRSSCAADDGEHRAYSKRTMGGDMVLLMEALGFPRFGVMGHDRGGRVAYRLALDWPKAITALVVLDIMTTWDQWQPQHAVTQQRLAHWAFLAQPAPIPEALIGADPVAWLEGRLRRGTLTRSLEAIDPRALSDYRALLSDSDRVHATCEDYRAGAGCDLSDDREDRSAGRRIACPTLVVWGSQGSLADVANPVALWKPWCRAVSGCKVESGHFIPEENPAALLAAVLPFFEQAEARP
jgi:haloacetate dehalogenase